MMDMLVNQNPLCCLHQDTLVSICFGVAV